jgi:hypothetical protein
VRPILAGKGGEGVIWLGEFHFRECEEAGVAGELSAECHGIKARHARVEHRNETRAAGGALSAPRSHRGGGDNL